MLMEVLSLHPWTGRLLSVWFGPIFGGVPARQHWGSSRLLFGLVARALAAALVGHTRAADRRHGRGRSDPPLSSKETEDCQGRGGGGGRAVRRAMAPDAFTSGDAAGVSV